jgi:hypothetical protein
MSVNSKTCKNLKMKASHPLYNLSQFQRNSTGKKAFGIIKAQTAEIFVRKIFFTIFFN